MFRRMVGGVGRRVLPALFALVALGAYSGIALAQSLTPSGPVVVSNMDAASSVKSVLDANAVLAIGTLVTGAAQVVKWLPFVQDRWGPIVVIFLSAGGVFLYVYSFGAFTRQEAFGIATSIVAVTTTSAGIFGLVRATQPAHVTATRQPPPGAAQARVGKLA